MAKMIYRDPTGLARVVIIMLSLCLFFDSVSAVSDILEAQLISNVIEGVEMTEEMADSNDNRQLTIGFINMGNIVITSLIFLKWNYRICRNAHYFSSESQRHKPGWAVGFYFVPFANLIYPFQAIKDALTTFIIQNQMDEYNDDRTSPVFVWWIVWIIGGILGLLHDKFASNADDLKTMLYVSVTGCFLNLFFVFSDIAAILMVNTLTNACVACKQNSSGEEDEEFFKSEETI